MSVLSLLLAGCVGGCGESSSTASSPDAAGVVASVAGQVLTVREVEARAGNVALLFCHKHGSTNVYDKIYKTFVKGYAKVWVEDTVLANEAAKAKVAPGVEKLAQYRDAAFRNFKAKGDRSFDDLRAIPGFDAELMEKQIRSEALRTMMKDYWAERFPTNLPPTYAEDVRRQILLRNEELALTNRLQFAKATNVWERLKAGADFVETAKACTEISDEREDDCEWLAVDDQYLADDPELLRAVKRLKPGEFTPPVRGDNGIMIARLDGLDGDGAYMLSRVFFHLAAISYPAPAADIVAAAKRRHADELFARKLAECVESANPVYGENLNEQEGKEEVK